MQIIKTSTGNLILRKGFFPFYKYYDFHYEDWDKFFGGGLPESYRNQTDNIYNVYAVIKEEVKVDVVYKVTKKLNKALIQEL